MFTISLWEDYLDNRYYYIDGEGKKNIYTGFMEIFMCLLMSILTIPFDIIFLPFEIITYIIYKKIK